MAFTAVLHFFGVVFWWTGNWEIVLRKRDKYRENVPAPVQERKPEPSPDGFFPFIRANNKPMVYQQVTTAPKFDPERYLAFTLCRWHENGREEDLTEKYWVIEKRLWKRSDFASRMKAWDRNSLTYRVNANKNAPRKIHNWKKVREIRDGGPLPH